MSKARFEIVQTEPEGEGRQPYFLRLIGANGSDNIVHSENYAHRAGAEGAFVSLAKALMATDPEASLLVRWNKDRTKGYLMSEGWMFSHTPVHFVSEIEPAEQKAAKKPSRTRRMAPAEKAAPAVE